MRIAFTLLARLPLWLLHACGWVMGWLVFVASASYRAQLRSNAEQAGVARSAWRGAVGEAGKLVCELPRLWMGSSAPVQWVGAEHIEQAMQTGRGILLLTPHMGCFEVTAQAYALRFGVHGKPITVLYRPARQAWLSALMETVRMRPGLDTAPATLAGVKKLMKALQRGECVGLLPDQVPPLGQGVWLPFFGRDAYTMTLPARLALQSRAHLLLIWGERLPRGQGYVVRVQPLNAPAGQDVQALTLSINQAMERMVLACPTQYLWGYARYKVPRDGSAKGAL